jgi:hypothetical protein
VADRTANSVGPFTTRKYQRAHHHTYFRNDEVNQELRRLELAVAASLFTVLIACGAEYFLHASSRVQSPNFQLPPGELAS